MNLLAPEFYFKYFELEILFTHINGYDQICLTQHDMSQQCLYKLNEISFFLKKKIELIDFQFKNQLWDAAGKDIFNEENGKNKVSAFLLYCKWL